MKTTRLTAKHPNIPPNHILATKGRRNLSLCDCRVLEWFSSMLSLLPPVNTAMHVVLSIYPDTPIEH